MISTSTRAHAAPTLSLVLALVGLAPSPNAAADPPASPAPCVDQVVEPGQEAVIERALLVQAPGAEAGDIRIEAKAIEASWSLAAGGGSVQLLYRITRAMPGQDRASKAAFVAGALRVVRLSPCGGADGTAAQGCAPPAVREAIGAFEDKMRLALGASGGGIRWRCPGRADHAAGGQGEIGEKLESIHRALSEGRLGDARKETKALVAGLDEGKLRIGERIDLAIAQAQLGDHAASKHWLEASLRLKARSAAEADLQLAAELALGKRAPEAADAGPCSAGGSPCAAVVAADLLQRLGRAKLVAAVLDGAVMGTERPSAAWYEARIAISQRLPEADGGVDKTAILLKRATEAFPDNLAFHREAVYLYRRSKRYAEALPHIRAMFRLQPDDTEADVALVAGFRFIHDPQTSNREARLAWQADIEARRAWLQGKTPTPLDLFEEGLVAYYDKDFGRAIELLKKAATSYPMRIQILTHLAEASVGLSEQLQRSAEEYADRALQVAPNDPAAHLCNATVRGRVDRPAALKSMRKALELGSGKDEGRKIEDKEVEEALKMLTGAVAPAQQATSAVAAEASLEAPPLDGAEEEPDSDEIPRRWLLVGWVLALVAGCLYLLWRR